MAINPQPHQAAAAQFYRLIQRESQVLDRLLEALQQTPAEPILNSSSIVEQDPTAPDTSSAAAIHMEALHQLRVRARRLHTLMNQLGKHLPSSLRRLQSNYRQFIKATNVLRDLDVLEQRLRLWLHNGDSSTRHACIYLHDQAQGKRDGSTMTQTSDPSMMNWLPEQVWLQHSTPVPDYASQLGETWFTGFNRLNKQLRKKLKQAQKQAPQKPLLAKLLSKRILQLQEDIQSEFKAWNDGDAEAAHDLRISIKQLRYLLQPWRQLMPRFEPLLKLLKPMQEALGWYHDNHIQQAWLAQQTPRIAQQYYQQCCDYLQQHPGHSRYALQRHFPSPMNGLISIAMDLQYQQRMMEQWLQETFNESLQQVLFQALVLLSEELKHTHTQAQ